MSNGPNEDGPVSYQIKVEGHLQEHWATWFEAMTVTQEKDGTTTLCGPLRDQAALHSILRKIRDLNLPLISVNRAT